MNMQKDLKNGTQVLGSFFAKPMTLAIAAVFAISAIVNFICGKASGVDTGLDIPSICLSIGFFMLFFRAKRSNVLTNYNAPLTLIKVISIISAIVSILALVATIFFFFSSFLLVVKSPELSDIVRNISLFGLVVISVYCVYSIGFALFASSMKKTSLILEIKKKGSILTAVSGVLSVIVVIVCIIAFLSSFDEMIASFINVFKEYFNEEIASINENLIVFDDFRMMVASDFAPAVVYLIIYCVNILITSAYTAYYYLYMKNIEKDYVPERATHTTPYHNLYGNKQKTAIDFKKAAAVDPMYVAAAMSTLPKDRINCPKCNAVVETNLEFCPMCGYRLEEKTETNNS